LASSYGYVSEFKRRIYYTFATGVAGFWAKRKLKGKEASILKWPLSIIIMVLDFIYGFAAMEFEKSGSSSMIWLVLAYLFHTIGELCLSPALSFTKLFQ
jgi:POT family proton-dependent oligopeptide transporter